MLARAVTDLESNVQAYRTMAEMLVGLRKIVLHGLRKDSGDRWPTEGCPPQVYERLVQRKETELAIERLTLEDEDLMSFATFEDLAETIQANDRLAGLLHNLAPSADVLCARLSDLETLRGKLARAIVLNPDELKLLSRYSSHLRETMAGVRRKTRKGGAGAGAEDDAPVTRIGGVGPRARAQSEPVQPVAAPEAALERKPGGTVAQKAKPKPPERRDEEALRGKEKPAAVPREKPPPVRPVQPPVDAAARTKPKRVAAPPREKGDGAGQAPPGAATAPAAFDPETLAEDVQKAMVDEDDVEVLRLLRREVVATAEAMYRGDGDIRARGWEEVERDGWLGRCREELALEPLERFHHLRAEYGERQRSAGSSREVLRELLAEREFPKLLLRLREAFLRNGL